jgi:hypothetical protein
MGSGLGPLAATAVAVLRVGSLVVGACAIAGARAQAQDPTPARPPSEVRPPSATATPSAAKRPLGLDSILQPRTVRPAAPTETRGGRTRQEWSDAFAGARREIAGLESKVEQSRQKLASGSEGGQYQYSPLGGGTPTDPETLKSRAQLKRDRESLEAARRRLRDLEVEASLSGVPREWFDGKEQPASP